MNHASALSAPGLTWVSKRLPTTSNPPSIDFGHNRNYAEVLRSVEYERSPDCRACDQGSRQQCPSQTAYQRHKYHSNRQTYNSDTRWQVSTLAIGSIELLLIFCIADHLSEVIPGRPAMRDRS